VTASPQGIADDGVFIDAGQACGLSHATAVLKVLEDGEGLVRLEPRTKEGGAFAFGEAGLARAAGEHAPPVPGVAKADAEVALAAQAIVGAVGVLTAKEVEVFHEQQTPQ
jgi:hypothetical protein